MATIGDSIKTDDFKNEKHVPVIELPEGAKKEEAFPVSVTVGKEIAHPNTTAHHIAWAELYFKPEGAGPLYCLGKASFEAHGATTDGADATTLHTDPVALFHVRIAKPGELIALIYCNIHGLWEGRAQASV